MKTFPSQFCKLEVICKLVMYFCSFRSARLQGKFGESARQITPCQAQKFDVRECGGVGERKDRYLI